MRSKRAPGQRAPTLPLRIKQRLRFGTGCLRLCSTTCASFFHLTVLTSAYPGHYPRPSLFEPSFSQAQCLAPTCRLDHRQERSLELSRSDDPFCVALGLCSPPDSCRVKENVWKPFSQGLQVISCSLLSLPFGQVC